MRGFRVVDGTSRGLVDALNLGLSRARGEFIARMDSDDVSLPHRFARQVEYLRAHPDIAVVGSTITLIDATGAMVRDIDYPLAPADIDRFLVETGCALAHPTVMARRQALLALGGYRTLFQHGEDYDLWLRVAERYSLANLPDRLLRYRHHATKGSLRHATAQRLATHVAKLCAKARRSGQGDPFEGQSSLSLDDLDRFDLAAGEREAIVRDVIGAGPTADSPAATAPAETTDPAAALAPPRANDPPAETPRISLKARARHAAFLGLQRVLPAAWFARVRNLARARRPIA